MKRHALVLYIRIDDAGQLHGELYEPMSAWRQSFHCGDELWAHLARFAAVPPVEIVQLSSNESIMQANNEGM